MVSKNQIMEAPVEVDDMDDITDSLANTIFKSGFL